MSRPVWVVVLFIVYAVFALAPALLAAPVVEQPGFEAPDIAANSFVRADLGTVPAGSPWTFSGPAGMVDGVSATYNNLAPPEGSQAALLQSFGGNLSVIFQLVGGFDVGQGYQVSFLESTRPTQGALSYAVLVDSVPVLARTTASGQAWTPQTSSSFVATSASMLLAFQAPGQLSDGTVFLDSITITPIPEPAVAGLALTAGLLSTTRLRRGTQGC
jgi:hypothetical protein